MTDWPIKTLGEVCDLVGGGTPSKESPEFYGGNIPWATVRDMNVEVLRSTEHSITSQALSSSSSNVIPVGSVVIATRVGLGKAVILGQDTAINQDLRGLVVKNPKAISSNYLYWWYLSTAHLVVAAGTGATVQGVKLPFVSGLEIPVPPLEEQKRIVALLDAATARITELTACYEQARNHANNLFTSALREFMSDSVDMIRMSLSDICTVDWGNTDLTKKSYIENGKYLAVSAAGPDGRIGHAEHKAFTPVLSAIGARCGRMFLPEEDFTAIKNTITLTPKPDIAGGKYIFYLFEHLSLPIRGAAQPFMAKGDIEKFEVGVPPLEEQKQIVARLDAMRATTFEMVEAYDAKLQAAKDLRQSILEAAFAGEL